MTTKHAPLAVAVALIAGVAASLGCGGRKRAPAAGTPRMADVTVDCPRYGVSVIVPAGWSCSIGTGGRDPMRVGEDGTSNQVIGILPAQPRPEGRGPASSYWMRRLLVEPRSRRHVSGITTYREIDEPAVRLYAAIGSYDRSSNRTAPDTRIAGYAVGSDLYARFLEVRTESAPAGSRAALDRVLASIRLSAPAAGEARCERMGLSAAVPPGWACESSDWMGVWTQGRPREGVGFWIPSKITTGAGWGDSKWISWVRSAPEFRNVIRGPIAYNWLKEAHTNLYFAQGQAEGIPATEPRALRVRGVAVANGQIVGFEETFTDGQSKERREALDTIMRSIQLNAP